jgi:hypothetical protein
MKNLSAKQSSRMANAVHGGLKLNNFLCLSKKKHKPRYFCYHSFECKHLDVRDSKKCYFRGKELNEGDEIDEKLLDSSCIGAAQCSENGIFTHAHIDCAEFFGPRLQPDCIRQYSKDSCCSVGSVCGN